MPANLAPLLNLAGTIYSASKGKKAQQQGQQYLTQNLDWVKNLMPKQWQVATPVGNMNITPGGVSTNFTSPFRQGLMNTGGMFDNAYWNAGQLLGGGHALYDAANQYQPYEQQQAALGGDWRGLRDRVAPGYSQIRDVRRTALGDARTQGLGNLRNTLAQRRMAGSSFGNQALSGLEADYGRAMADSDAKTFLEEMDATQRIYAGEAAQATAAAQMLANRLATQSGALDSMGKAVGYQGELARGKSQAATAGLDADLRFLSESMGGMRNMMDFIANMSQIITGNSTALGELATASASGWGGLAGQLLPNILPKQNPYTGGWTNPWSTS